MCIVEPAAIWMPQLKRKPVRLHHPTVGDGRMKRATAALLVVAGIHGCAAEPEPPPESAPEAIAVLPFVTVGEADPGVVRRLESSFRGHIAGLDIGSVLPPKVVEEYRGHHPLAEASDIQKDLRIKCLIEAGVGTKGQQVRFTMQVRGAEGSVIGSGALVYDDGTREEADVVADMARSVRLGRCAAVPLASTEVQPNKR